MAFDYLASAATANRLLTQFGRVVTHNSVSEGVYDVETASVVNIVTPQTGIGVLLEYSTQDKGVQTQGGSLIQTNDRKLLLGTQGINVAPAPNDTVVFDGVTYTVQECATLAPAGVPVLYELQVRR